MKKILTKFLPQFTINLEAGDYLEYFLVSAVASVFCIRVFLSLTGYPQLGGAGLHIAHMLWGGFLMMISMIILLSFLTRGVKTFASIIGGLGFGIFIDELGKFITSDNNYFFQPTIALIYLIFVILFFLFRSIEKYVTSSDKDYVINSLELLKEVIHYDLDEEEKKRALFYLNKCQKKDPTVKHLLTTIKAIKPKPSLNNNIFLISKRYLHTKLLRLINNQSFAKILASLFVLASLINILVTFIKLNVFKKAHLFSFWDWGQLISTLAIGIVVMAGVYFHRKQKKLTAHVLFKHAVMIDIFLGQFFLFYREGLSSYMRLLINVLVFFCLQYLISQEKVLEKK